MLIEEGKFWIKEFSEFFKMFIFVYIIVIVGLGN